MINERTARILLIFIFRVNVGGKRIPYWPLIWTGKARSHSLDVNLNKKATDTSLEWAIKRKYTGTLFLIFLIEQWYGKSNINSHRDPPKSPTSQSLLCWQPIIKIWNQKESVLLPQKFNEEVYPNKSVIGSDSNQSINPWINTYQTLW